jgi:N-acetylglucosaminyldiphosphoundecaprenol N-acetyl-beta-D-mannosaminyltransferase
MNRFGLNTFTIAEIRLIGSFKAQLLAELEKKIDSRHKIFVVTPNPEFIVFAQANPWFKKILNQADLAIPDGVGLVWASKLLGNPIKERISGTDLMENLCQLAAKKNWSVYLLGGWPGVAQKALAVLKKRYPGLKGWAETGPKISNQEFRIKNNEFWVKKINQKKPDLLFVALGMGKQEKLIADNWPDLKVKLAMGVGGAFDYLSGEIPRAPNWLRKIGFEWFYRLIREPWRWRRQLALVRFVWLVVKEKFFETF